MHLVVFDIDGTLLNSVDADDACFIQTYRDLHNIDLGVVDWNTFEHVTDAGLTREIFRRWRDRLPFAEEVAAIKAHFFQLLEERTHEFRPIPHVRSFLQMLNTDPSYALGFATGGWRETAELKCRAAGIELTNVILKSSNDHFDRTRIMELAIEEARQRYKISAFKHITYFGDGLWDWRATQALGVEFIGVDHNRTGKLARARVSRVITDYGNTNHILSWLNHTTR